MSGTAARSADTRRHRGVTPEATEYPPLLPRNPYVKPLIGMAATALVGAAAAYGFTITFPARAGAATETASAVTPVVPPKVQLLSESDVHLVAEHAAKAAADEVLSRVDARRLEDMTHIDQRLDALSVKLDAATLRRGR